MALLTYFNEKNKCSDLVSFAFAFAIAFTIAIKKIKKKKIRL